MDWTHTTYYDSLNWEEYSNTDTITINYHNFIIYKLNITKFYV